MKTSKNSLFFLFLIFTLTSFLKTEAQVTIGGQIDIKIGLPEVVIVNRTPRRAPMPMPRRRRPVIVRERIPAPEPCHCEVGSLGTIMNQNNGPRFDYQVVDASVKYFGNNELDVILNMDTGDVMVITMVELNPNDYNFHFCSRPNNYSNAILNIALNGAPIALNSAAVSLQPKGKHGFTAVLNLHSIYAGDFNGTVDNRY